MSYVTKLQELAKRAATFLGLTDKDPSTSVSSKNPKADLLTMSLITLNSSVFDSQAEQNAILWVNDLIVDPDIPAKRRLYAAVNIADHPQSEISNLGIKVFNQLCADSGIRAKFRLRAARRLLRDTSDRNTSMANSAAQQQVKLLSEKMQRKPVDALTPHPPYSVKGWRESIACVPGPTEKLPRHHHLDEKLRL